MWSTSTNGFCVGVQGAGLPRQCWSAAGGDNPRVPGLADHGRSHREVQEPPTRDCGVSSYCPGKRYYLAQCYSGSSYEFLEFRIWVRIRILPMLFKHFENYFKNTLW